MDGLALYQGGNRVDADGPVNVQSRRVTVRLILFPHLAPCSLRFPGRAVLMELARWQ